MNGKTTPITTAVLDNDVMAAEAIRAYLPRLCPRSQVVWHTTSPALAIHRCTAGVTPPDVLLADMALDGISGLEVCRTIRAMNSHTGLIGVTAYDIARYAGAAADSGMQALLAKDTLVTTLAPALEAVAAGGVWPCDSGLRSATDAHTALIQGGAEPSAAMLSERERDVLRRYAAGEATDDIAVALGISRNSVFTYTRRLCAKLGVGTRGEAVRLSRRRHWFG